MTDPQQPDDQPDSPIYGPASYPPGSRQDVSLYNYLFAFWDALWERNTFGSGEWPPAQMDWFGPGGIEVKSVTTDSNGNYVLNFGSNPGVSWVYTYSGSNGDLQGKTLARWWDYYPPKGSPGIPTYYEVRLVDDPRQPWAVVGGWIVGQNPPDAQGNVQSGTDCTFTISPSNGGNGISIQHALVGKFLDSPQDLVGRKCHIFKRGGWWSSDRMPELPNDHEAWLAFCNGGQDHYPPKPVDKDGDGVPDNPDAPPEGPLYCYAETTDEKTSWALDEWVGFELLVFGDGGQLHRVPILHNDARRVYWTVDNTWNAYGTFSIVEAGSRGIPGRHKWRPGVSYAGAADGYYTHSPVTDGMMGCNFAARTVGWYENKGTDAIDCKLVQHVGPEGTALDADMVINGPAESPQFDAECDSGRTGDFCSPRLFTSARALQHTMLAICGGYVRNVPSGSTPVEMYCPATLCIDLGNYSGSSSISSDENNTPYFTVDQEGKRAGSVYWFSPYVPATDKFPQKPFRSGKCGVHADGKAYPDGFSTPQDTTNGTDAGCSILWSPGLRRYWEKRVQYLTPKTGFLPDIYSDPTQAFPVDKIMDPPSPTKIYRNDGTGDFPNWVWTGKWSSEGTGEWIRRDKSYSYAEFDDYGFLSGGPAFVTGDLARLWGDNYGDPTLDERIRTDTDPTSHQVMLLPYYDHWFRGTYSPKLEAVYRGNRGGNSSGGNAGKLTDKGKGWWTDGVNGGSLVTHSYTSTAGDASSVTFSLDVDDETVAESRWYDINQRWTGMPSAKPFVDFVVEIDRTETVPNPDYDSTDPNSQKTKQEAVTHKFVIRDIVTTNKKVQFTFDEEDQSAEPDEFGNKPFKVVAGMAVRVREPRYALNKFEGDTVTLTDPDDTVYHATVTHNDDDTLWFDKITDEDGGSYSSLTIGEGWKYAVGYIAPGSVLKWNGSKWIQPTGTDTARMGTGGAAHDFLPNSSGNLPTYVKGYGLHRRHDRIWGNEMLTELYNGINLLLRTRYGFGFRSSADPTKPEQNCSRLRDNEPTETGGYYNPGGDKNDQYYWKGERWDSDYEYARGEYVAINGASSGYPRLYGGDANPRMNFSISGLVSGTKSYNDFHSDIVITQFSMSAATLNTGYPFANGIPRGFRRRWTCMRRRRLTKPTMRRVTRAMITQGPAT